MPEPLPAIDEPTVIFVINRLWSPDSDDESVYAVTRGDWKVGASTRERARIALGIAGNVVRGAYRIDGWQPGGESGRWRFNGTPAHELDAVGKTVVHLAPRAGAANPIRRFLDGVPQSTPPVGAASEHMPERITPAPPSANPAPLSSSDVLPRSRTTRRRPGGGSDQPIDFAKLGAQILCERCCGAAGS